MSAKEHMKTRQLDARDLNFETIRPIDLGTDALKSGSTATPMSTLVYAVASGDMETVEAQITEDIEWGIMPYNKVLKGKDSRLCRCSRPDRRNRKNLSL